MAKETKKEVVQESDERKAFALIIEAYKVQSPAKYELRKAELEAKLAKL